MNPGQKGDYHYSNGVDPKHNPVKDHAVTTSGTFTQSRATHHPKQHRGSADSSTTSTPSRVPHYPIQGGEQTWPGKGTQNGFQSQADGFNGVTPFQSQANGYNGVITSGIISRSRARHPEFADRNNRLFSYTTWRIRDVQDPTKLANLGFFYTGEDDLIRCFYCSIGLKDFIKSDDPLLEHVRYSGNCEFLIQLLGPSRLREIKESLLDGRAGDSGATNEYLHTPQGGADAQAHSEIKSVEKKPQREVTRYRHPQYSSCQVRISSYSGWPTHLVQTPQKLAEAGFFYTGVRDIVRCFGCDGGLQKWDPTDDPWIEHCINFPTCVYLRETKGEDYIALAIEHHRQQTRPIEAKPEPLDQTFDNLRIEDKSTIEKAADTKERNKLQVVAMGYSIDDVNTAVDSLNRERKETTVEEILDEIEKRRAEANLDPKAILMDNQRLKEQLFCASCKESDINVLFLPCQHHKFCEGCSKRMSKCSICGAAIAHRIKTYRP